MRLSQLPTPCLVLDRGVLVRNLETMAARVTAFGCALRPHMKTAKCIEVARLATGGQLGAITVSTLAEAEYFAAHGALDILYAAGITPDKLEQVAKLNATGADVAVITDDPDTASVIAAYSTSIRALIEIDTGEGRGGVPPDDPVLLQIAGRLGRSLSGVMTHAGHSYNGRSAADMTQYAEVERFGVVHAAEWLRANGHACPIVSMGSTPTALHAQRLDGITEVRAGVYMFGDLFQAAIGSHGLEDIAVHVLASVIGRRPNEHRFLIDAGGLAMSKDRSTEATPHDCGFGLVLGLDGSTSFGGAVIRRAYQEHGVVDCDPTLPFPNLRVGDRVRVAPNHTCMTVAAHDRYHVVDGTEDVVGVWARVNGW